MPVNTIIRIVRFTFVILSVLIGLALAFGGRENIQPWMGATCGLVFGGMLVMVDMLLKNLTIRSFSAGTIGLLIGVLCAWLITQIPGIPPVDTRDGEKADEIKRAIHTMLYAALGYIGIIIALRSNRQEFSLIIPYVRFRNDGVMRQPLLIDTNIIIDGRLPALCQTGFLDGALLIPRFVLDELHLLADSADSLKRDRGRRGLDCLESLKRLSNVEVTIHDDYQSQEKLIDSKLVQLAKLLDARLLTNDGNLGRVAQLQGVGVLNLNQLTQSMRPILAIGDEVDITLVKEGRDDHQAVGYTPDGAMIVVNHARDRIGSTTAVIVSSMLQTSAGRLVFAELKSSKVSKPAALALDGK